MDSSYLLAKNGNYELTAPDDEAIRLICENGTLRFAGLHSADQLSAWKIRDMQGKGNVPLNTNFAIDSPGQFELTGPDGATVGIVQENGTLKLIGLAISGTAGGWRLKPIESRQTAGQSR